MSTQVDFNAALYGQKSRILSAMDEALIELGYAKAIDRQKLHRVFRARLESKLAGWSPVPDSTVRKQADSNVTATVQAGQIITAESHQWPFRRPESSESR